MIGACDSHIHIYDPRFQMPWPDRRAVPNASVAEYRQVQQRLGTTRAIVVQPAAYGTDNAVTLAAIAQLGIDNARGIAVVHPAVTQAQLLAMDAGGVRGIRFTLHDPRTAVTSPDMIEPLAHRVAALGWHLQVHLRGEQIVAMEELLMGLPGTLVFDHMARLPQPEGAAYPAFGIVRRLLDRGRTWIKLSGPYLDSRREPPGYADIGPVARAFVVHAPERCVWGSDWPHPTEHAKPDDAALLALLSEWTPQESVRRKILVDNAAELYGFTIPTPK